MPHTVLLHVAKSREEPRAEAKSLVKKLLTPDLGWALGSLSFDCHASAALVMLVLSSLCHRPLMGRRVSHAGKRFGNLKNGAADIKEHKWFKALHPFSCVASFVAISRDRTLAGMTCLRRRLRLPSSPWPGLPAGMSSRHLMCRCSRSVALRPAVKGATDTSNFDDYPDSDQEPPAVNA